MHSPNRHPFIFTTLCAALTLAGNAHAVIDCGVDGKPINLDHGASTAGLTGIVRCVDRDTGQPRREIPYRNGRQHGVEKMVIWTENKTLQTEYREGRKHGPQRRLNAAGGVESETYYENDVERGPARVFYANGKVKRETEFGESANGMAPRFVREFTEDGKLATLRHGNGAIGVPGFPYGDFSGSMTLHHADGRPRDLLVFRQGLLDGRIERFRADGSPSAREEWKAGMLDGLSQGLQEDGRTLYREARFAASAYDGIEKEYFAGTAQVSAEREWRAGMLTREKRYYQNGRPEQEIAREGDAIQVQFFWDDGKPKSRGPHALRRAETRPFKAEARVFDPRPRSRPAAGVVSEFWPALMPNGMQQTFFASGARKSESVYRMGKRDGAEKTWHENGQLATESQYVNGALAALKEYDKEGKTLRDETYHPDGSRKLS